MIGALTRSPARQRVGALKNFPTLLGLVLLAVGHASSCNKPSAAFGPAATRLPVVLTHGFPMRIRAGAKEIVLAAPPRRVLPANAAWVDYVSLLVGPERLAALP